MDIYKQEVHVFPVEGMFAAHVCVQELLQAEPLVTGVAGVPSVLRRYKTYITYPFQ